MPGRREQVNRAGGGPPSRGAIGLRRLHDDDFVLVHPRCVHDRRDDLEEGLAIAKAGEPEEAREVLRFALDGCGDNLFIHVALGQLALDVFRDPQLARGHFGYAIELVQRALPQNFQGRLPSDQPANRPLYDALDGLIRTLEALGQPAEADRLRRLAQSWSRT